MSQPLNMIPRQYRTQSHYIDNGPTSLTCSSTLLIWVSSKNNNVIQEAAKIHPACHLDANGINQEVAQK